MATTEHLGMNIYLFNRNSRVQGSKFRIEIEHTVEKIAKLHGFEPSILLSHLTMAMFTIANQYSYGYERSYDSVAIPHVPDLSVRVSTYSLMANALGSDLTGIVSEYLWLVSSETKANGHRKTSKAMAMHNIASMTPFKRWIVLRYATPDVTLPYVDDLMKELHDTRPDIVATSAKEIELFINSSTTMNRVKQKSVEGGWYDNNPITHIRNIRSLLNHFGLGR
jgi:hypothetical protein